MNDAIRDQAALWMAQARDPRFADWDALTEWLEADPAHNLAYETAFAAHDLAGQLATAPGQERVGIIPASAPPWRRRGLIGGGVTGVVAAAAALLALILPLGPQAAEIVAETGPGQHRLVHLKDGTEIALNGDTRIVLDRTNGRTARLERGEAMFSVVHDEMRPFTVDVGGTRMIDLGTRFDVLRNGRGSEVAVAEGAVLYDPEGAAVRLGPGRMLRKAEHSQIVEVSQTDPSTVGAWRSGQLVYREAPLWRVADDLSRAMGARIAVDPAVANRPFTGAITFGSADRATLARRLGAVLNVAVAQQPDGLYLKARALR